MGEKKLNEIMSMIDELERNFTEVKHEWDILRAQLEAVRADWKKYTTDKSAREQESAYCRLDALLQPDIGKGEG